MQPIYEEFREIANDRCAHLLSPVVAHRRILVS
jgi:hypothetical protein